jgi:fructan beta-fructosidase
MNDPNGMFYYQGQWHLFYQYNPFGDRWGHMSWGHATSNDLTHWKHLPVAIAEEDGVMIFSGSAVVDWKNTSGFGIGDKPPLVAIYTGHRDGHQDQRIAYSNDEGLTWTKYQSNPVLDVNMADFRDPKVSWHEDTSRWIMTVALPTEHKVHFYASTDLKSWKYVGEFGNAGSIDGIWECPDLFPLKTEDGQTKWVLIVNLSPGAPAGGSGTQYFVGNFDGNTFTTDKPTETGMQNALWADYGADFYAGVSWTDVPSNDGRRVWLGWMSNWRYAGDVPTNPWRSAMSVPRQLSLKQTGQGFQMVQQPVTELNSLRGEKSMFTGGSIEQANAWINKENLRSGPMELLLEIDQIAEPIGVKLYSGEGQETVVGIGQGGKDVSVDRTKSGQVGFHKDFSAVQKAPVANADGSIKLHLVIDVSSVEVFANDGLQTISSLIFPDPTKDKIELSGSKAHVKSIEAWPLKKSMGTSN